MKKQLLLSTILAAALAAGSAHAGSGMKATDAAGEPSQQQGMSDQQSPSAAGDSAQSGSMQGTQITPTDESGYEPSRVGVGGVTADRSAQITNNTDAVRQIQQALKDQGADIQVDGLWGENTQQALMKFQKEQGQAEATGEPDRETLQALDVDLYSEQPQTAETPADNPPDSATPLSTPGAGNPPESWATGGQAGAGAGSDTGSPSEPASGSSQ